MRTLALGLLLACSGDDPKSDTGGTGGDADTDLDTDTDVDTDTDTDVDTDTIPDPYASLDRTACEGGAYVDNTMTAWFVGDLVVSGTTFTGTETAAVHWSPNFVSECGYAADCVIVWALTGTVGAPGACADCDYSLEVDATLDAAATDCPTDRIGDVSPDTWSTTYDVKLNPDGTTEVSFSQSGNPLGAWYWAGDRVTYVTGQPVCFPYPDDLSAVCP
jgi:hypothetical protein